MIILERYILLSVYYVTVAGAIVGGVIGGLLAFVLILVAGMVAALLGFIVHSRKNVLGMCLHTFMAFASVVDLCTQTPATYVDAKTTKPKTPSAR